MKQIICLTLIAGQQLANAVPALGNELAVGPALPVTYSYNLDPTLSPDGKRMVFIKILEGREQLFIANSEGTAERQLTNDGVDLEDPAWSPDGKSIVLVTRRPN